MDTTNEIERFDPLTAGIGDISRINDKALRTQALELWSHVPDLTSEERRFLPATVVQIADQFSEDEPAAARIALSAASILLSTGEIGSDGLLDDQDMDSIGNVAQAMTTMGLEGVDASYMASYFGVNASLGGLLALSKLYEEILDLTPEAVAEIRAHLGLDYDVSEDDFYALDYSEENEDNEDDEDYDDLTDEEDTDEDKISEVEQSSEEVSIEHLQQVLGRLGLSGVDVVTLAGHFSIPLDTTEALDELTTSLSAISNKDLDELRFMTDASAKIRARSIELDLENYRHAIAQIHEEESFDDDTAGTTSSVTDESGEVFEL